MRLVSPRLLLVVLLALAGAIAAEPFLTSGTGTTVHAQSRKKKSTAKKAPKKTSKKSSKKSRKTKRKKYAPKRKRRSSSPRIRSSRSVEADSSLVEELAPGVVHQWMTTRGKHVANIVSIDLKTNARLRSFKALDRYDGLEKVVDMFERADSVLDDTVVAAANASFWKATYNSPIGATVRDGELIELPGYKSWSSLLLYHDGTAAIDRIRLAGELVWRHRHFTVDGVNHRASEEGLVVYNHYFGETVPRGTRKSDSAILAEVLSNEVSPDIGDDTERPVIDTVGLIQAYRTAQMQEDREYPLLKVACRFIPPRRRRDPMPTPSIGDTMKLYVTAVDTGAVEIPEDGFVISLGVEQEYFTVVQVGDTVRLLYRITPEQSKPIRDILTGTPRIVRDGVPHPEHEIEGSKATRFVQGALSRTGVGISRNGDTLWVVTVNSSNPAESTSGMTLQEMANFLASIGAYQAINFDGGGSATMVIDGETVSRMRGAPFNRRVSTALLVVKEKIEERQQRRTKPRRTTGGQ